MPPSRRFFSGDSLEQALLQAARHFQLEPDEIAYEQIEKRHGFLKVRRRVVIAVPEEAPRRDPGAEARPAEESPVPGPVEQPAPAEAPPLQSDEPAPPPAPVEREVRPPAPPVAPRERKRDLVELSEGPRRAIERFPRATGERAEAAGEALRRLLRLGDLEVDFEILQGEERLEIELWGPDQDRLLADRGRVLLAIQHLTPRLIRGLCGLPTPCRVDCDNFHEIRAERLRDLAQRAANEVQRRGRPKTLGPMSPDERRIIHLTLADDSSVDTESKGGGLFKRVTVKPASGGRSGGFDRYNR